MPGIGWPSPAMTAAPSPMTKISGYPGSERSGPTRDRPARSCSPGRPATSAAARTPAAQTTVAASIRPCSRVTPVGVDVGDLGARSSPPRHSGRGAGRRRRRDARGRSAGSGVPPRSARCGRPPGRYGGTRTSARRGRSRRWPRPSRRRSDRRRPRRRWSRAGARAASPASSARSKADQDAPADGERVLDRLQPGREGLPGVVAEVGVGRAGGDHQLIIGDRPGLGEEPGAPPDRRRSRGSSAPGRWPGSSADAGSARRSPPATGRRWPPDRAAAGRCGGCLRVDHQHLGGGMGQGPRRLQAAEPAPIMTTRGSDIGDEALIRPHRSASSSPATRPSTSPGRPASRGPGPLRSPTPGPGWRIRPRTRCCGPGRRARWPRNRRAESVAPTGSPPGRPPTAQRRGVELGPIYPPVHRPGQHGEVIGQVSRRGLVKVEPGRRPRAARSLGHEGVAAVIVAMTGHHRKRRRDRCDLALQPLSDRRETIPRRRGEAGRGQQAGERSAQQMIGLQPEQAGRPGVGQAGLVHPRMAARPAPSDPPAPALRDPPD